MEHNNLYKGYVYLIYNNFDANVYVGETIQPINKRFKQHVYESNNTKQKSYNYLLSKAIRKYGYANFFVKELECVTGYDKKIVKNQIQELEKLYIKKYNSFECGYNMDEGGLGGKCQSEEIRKRLSNIKKQDPKTKERMDYARKFIKTSYTIAYNYCTGQKLNEFNSAKKAAEFYGLQGTDVTKMCKLVKNYRSFKDLKVTFRYKNDSFTPPYSIEVYTEDNILLDKFVFIKDGSEKYGVDSSSIVRCCKGKVKSAGTYLGKRLKWNYYGVGN